MTKCGDIDRQLTAYLEGFLPEKDRKIVEEHLSLCIHCAEALEDLRRTRAILAGMDEVDPPPWLAERIMSQIQEKEDQKEGIFRRLFFPLHIKIPVQALATVFVVVLSVYVYKSTLPETGNFERPVPGPQVSAPPSPAGVKDGAARRTARPSADPSAEQTTGRIMPKKEAAPVQEAAPVPSKSLSADKAAGRSYAAKDKAAVPAPQTALAGSTVPETPAHDSVAPSSAPPPSAEKAQRIKTRGMAAEEKKNATGESSLTPPRAVEPQYARARIVMLAVSPSEAARQAQAILRSLGGTGVEENRRDQTTTVSGKIDADALLQLRDRLKRIGTIDESSTRLEAGVRPVLVEIFIAGTANGREDTPAAR